MEKTFDDLKVAGIGTIVYLHNDNDKFRVTEVSKSVIVVSDGIGYVRITRKNFHIIRKFHKRKKK